MPATLTKAPPTGPTVEELRAERLRLMAEVDPRFLRALTKFNGPVPDPTRTLGWRWVRWIIKACRMGEGDRYGEPPRLPAWQQLLFWKMAELEDDGFRRFQFALLSFGKGAGKSPMAGWVGSVDLAGPSVICRRVTCPKCTDGWMPNGLPHGVRRASPDVIAIAASYEQSGLIFDEVKATFELGPLADEAVVGVATVTFRGGVRGKFRRLHATPKKVDGSKATTLLVDELHEFTTDIRTQAYDVASGGTAKRENGLTMVTTTAGFDLNSLLGKLVSRGLSGGFLRHEMFLYMVAGDHLDPKRWDSMLAEGRQAEVDKEIAEGILEANPLAQAGIARVGPLVSKFKGMPLFRALRYYWNRWTVSDESWLPTGAWDACKGAVVTDPTLRTWIGADMALTRDSAAVVVVQLRADGKYQATSRIWYPNGERIDQTECDDYIRSVCATHPVEWIAADEAWWNTLGDLEKGDTENPDVAKRFPPLPVFRMPQQGRAMIVAYTRLYRVIVDRILVHDGAPDFSDQIASAVPQSSDRGWTLKKGKHQKKIDSTPALAGAMYATTLEPPVVEAPPIRSEIF